MKTKFFVLGASLSIAVSAFAANPTKTTSSQSNAAKLQKKLNSLSKQASALQNQIQEIQDELNAAQPAGQPKATAAAPTPTQTKGQVVTRKHVPAQQGQVRPLLSPGQARSLDSQFYTLGPTVTTSPYLQLRSSYDASDLIVNYPTMNEDLRLLRQLQKIDNMLKGTDPPYFSHPRLVFSGTVQGLVTYRNPYHGVNNADVDLSDVELDALAEAGPWAFGFISLEYDNTAMTGGSRIANSRVYLNRGFLTIGNLNRTPFYGSIGQMYVPFGKYANYLVDSPITQTIARTNVRAVNLGFLYNGFYGQTYGFRGANNIGRTIAGGVNGGYRFTNNSVTGDFGLGVIDNIGDSQGMQFTGGSSFEGFGVSSADEDLAHPVPGLDLHGLVGMGNYTLISEYIAATRSFAAQNMAFNGHGARPQALDLEGAYNLNIFHRPTTLAVDYGQSWQALALNVPENSYIGLINISIWKDTIESLEYRHDVNYASSDTASGQGNSVTASGHRGQNTIYAQVAVYF